MFPNLGTLYQRLVINTLLPLSFLLAIPQVCILLPYIAVQKKGHFIDTFTSTSVRQVLADAWTSVDWFNINYWLLIIGIFTWACLLLVCLPGKSYYGPTTRNGYRPQFWDNGTPYYWLTMGIAVPIIWNYLMLQLYQQFTTIAGILIVFGLVLSGVVYVKGQLAPSPGDHASTGNPLYDFCWGTELYPQFGRFIHLKVLVFYRFAVILWQLIVLATFKAHLELQNGHPSWPMIVITITQSLYLAKINYLEAAYRYSLDNANKTLGFDFIGGCIAGVPSMYAFTSLYYVEHSPRCNSLFGVLFLVLGVSLVLLGFWTDYQRMIIRETAGQCRIWGRKPILISAKWIDSNGKTHQTFLLASGFWGLVRHPNYTVEIVTYFGMALPALGSTPVPFVLPAVLTFILAFRAARDDEKCFQKYGKYWREYCAMVPYKLIPGLF